MKEHLPSQYAEARYLVIDFSQTYGIDSSAANVFMKLFHFTQARQVKLVFVALHEAMQQQFVRGGFNLRPGSFYTFESLDHAVEWCEAAILSVSNLTMITSRSLVHNLGAFFTPAELSALEKYMQMLNVPENHRLIAQGESPPGLYFIESGQVTVYREIGDGRLIRLRTMGAGASVGEMSLYHGSLASATVLTDFPCRIYLFSREQMAEMESKDPVLAIKFHRYIIELLVQRLQNTTASVQALME